MHRLRCLGLLFSLSAEDAGGFRQTFSLQVNGVVVDLEPPVTEGRTGRTYRRQWLQQAVHASPFRPPTPQHTPRLTRACDNRHVVYDLSHRW
ncbi:hypothetical protein QC764_0019040 [Podospora pseudoanserina]|uniref:Secreted protein n=1 Tax=Podospora pseudoanserina TaxID=2609844 RepID=A0ABR0IPX5_9PEZI|nr:hypothetical protein QC764_0019040 [Podospora pseudoanserina]